MQQSRRKSVFTYRNTAGFWGFAGWLALAAPIIFFCIFMGEIPNVFWAVVLFLSLAGGVFTFLRWLNERFILDGGDLVWIDRFRRKTVIDIDSIPIGKIAWHHVLDRQRFWLPLQYRDR